MNKSVEQIFDTYSSVIPTESEVIINGIKRETKLAYEELERAYNTTQRYRNDMLYQGKFIESLKTYCYYLGKFEGLNLCYLEWSKNFDSEFEVFDYQKYLL